MMKQFFRIMIAVFCLLLMGMLSVFAADTVRGDANGDGIKTGADAVYLLRHTMMPNTYPLTQSADMNGDGAENSTDAVYLLRHILMPEKYPLICTHQNISSYVKAPTCTETGIENGIICSDCGEILDSDEKISALGHNYNSSICNTCGETLSFTTRGLSYSLLSDGTYCVYSHSIASLPQHIIIPPTYNGKPVTELRYVAFRDANHIKSVMMPNTIRKIGWESFTRCTSLENVYLPEGLTELAHYAFLECSSMESIKLPESLEIIDHNVFVDCAALKELYIPAKTASIGYNVFIGCDSLERYEIASGNPNYKSIDGVLYNKVGTVLRAYPLGRPDKTFTVPNGVKTIDSQAFSFAKYIEHVTISDSVTKIAGGAFYGCPNLRSIHLGSNVSTIEHSGYTTLIGGCPNFTTFTVSNYNWDFKAVDGVLYNKSGTKLLIYPVGKKETHYTFPANVTQVGPFALAYANNIESVFIPKTLKTYDGYAFYGCQKLKIIEWEEGCTRTGDGTAYECVNLTTAKLPSTITEIDSVVFNECESLTTVNIPHGVTRIEVVAFGNCESLETITIPSTVTFIGQYAFSHCSTLNVINYQGTQAQWNAITKEADWIRYVNGQIHIVCTDGTITFSRWH